MSFVSRLIQLTIQLAPNTQLNQPNTFAGTNNNTTTLPFLRTRVRVQNSGAPAVAKAQVDVFGLTPSLMNQLSTLGMQINRVPKNTIQVAAGDSSGLTTVFTGTISDAYADYNAAPDVPFHFECQFGLADATINTKATSFTGPTSVSSIMSGFAQRLNCNFENNGVNTQLSDPAFRGSIMDQVAACRAHAGIEAEFVGPYDQNGNPTLSIFPKYGSRNTNSSELVLIEAPPNGSMIGYPSFTQQGILVKTVFDPRIQYFRQVKVSSFVFNIGPTTALQRLNNPQSLWVVHKLDHALDSLVPGGLWESSVYGYSPNAVQQQPPIPPT
jgi:hypothetical protein